MARSKNPLSVPVAGLVFIPRKNGRPRYELHQFPNVKQALAFYTGKGWEIGRSVLYHRLQNENEYVTHLQKEDKFLTLTLKKNSEGDIQSLFGKDLEEIRTNYKESVPEKEEVVETEEPVEEAPTEPSVKVTIRGDYRESDKRKDELVVVPFLSIGDTREIFTVSIDAVSIVLKKEFPLFKKEIEEKRFYWIEGGVICKRDQVKGTLAFFKDKGIYSVLGWSDIVCQLNKFYLSAHAVEVSNGDT